MDKTALIAAALAPTLGVAIWWLAGRPGKWISDWLWKTLPDGKLRRVLLKKVD